MKKRTDVPRKVKKKVREKDIERRSCEYAEKRGYWHRKFASPGKRSVPDRLFAKRGVSLFAVEFKRPGEEPTKNQLEEITEMRNAGVQVYVVDNDQLFRDVIDTVELLWLS